MNYKPPPENYIMNKTKYMIVSTTNPKGVPNLAHSLLEIFSFEAVIIFGIFPGINIPPLINKPISIAVTVVIYKTFPFSFTFKSYFLAQYIPTCLNTPSGSERFHIAVFALISSISVIR